VVGAEEVGYYRVVEVAYCLPVVVVVAAARYSPVGAMAGAAYSPAAGAAGRSPEAGYCPVGGDSAVGHQGGHFQPNPRHHRQTGPRPIPRLEPTV